MEDNHQTRLVAVAVRRAQAGDREALGFLYARYADNVRGYVRSIVRDEHDAEDITQHVFAKLADVICKYEPRSGVTFLAWVLRVARNVALDDLRRRRTTPVEEIHLDSLHAVPGVGARIVHELREALRTLPDDQREVVLMRHLGGLSPGEIMQQTGRSAASVHGLHHRGRRALVSELITRGAVPTTVHAPAPPHVTSE